MRGAALVLGAAVLLGGCSPLAYYAQSIHGHLDLMGRERPIAELLADDAGADADLRRRLARVERIRDFASAELGLPDNGSYRSYAALDRPFVVWSVTAAPELSLDPVTWCFPFAGCVAYRGYFAREDALAFARQQKAAGHDVFVGGVPAYSTLGWLDDPLPSTVIHWSEHRLAGLVFHELAHQVVYVDDDTAFNEAFATAVQRAGVRRWLTATGDAAALAAYEEELAVEAELLAAVADLRDDLARLYASARPAAAKRTGKAELIAAFSESAGRRLAAAGSPGRRWARWLDQPVNNARLAALALYHHLVPGFEALLAEVDGDMAAFYRKVEILAAEERGGRRHRLAMAASSATGAP